MQRSLLVLYHHILKIERGDLNAYYYLAIAKGNNSLADTALHILSALGPYQGAICM